MGEIQHCTICAWREKCQLKFKLGKDGARYCPEYTRDVTIKTDPETDPGNADSETGDSRIHSEPGKIFTKKDYRPPKKRYFSLDDQDDGGEDS